MQKYLQNGELTLLDLQSFDSWVGMFAERITEFEVDVDTSGYRLATRFSTFHNLPELTSLLASVADFHQVDKSAGIPELDGYDDEVVGQSDGLCRFLKDISARAEDVRKGYVSKDTDNMLKITGDGRRQRWTCAWCSRNCPLPINPRFPDVQTFPLYRYTGKICCFRFKIIVRSETVGQC